MKYRESKIDKDLRSWFKSDFSKALLRRIQVVSGSIRGVTAVDIPLDYPIVAFAGINGAGKSTILAMTSCAYHANRDAYKSPRRKHPYYTFSDFFIQHSEEQALDGVEIRYHIAHDNWRKNERLPEGKGIAYQFRKKNKGGKWNDYSSRVRKTVVFLGIERIVPHSERSQSRSYSRSFADVKPKGWEEKVREVVGFILGKVYDDFRYLEHARYSLPLVKVKGVTYSGFNMGAGENALFEIFSTIYSCGEKALLVMDEIELGLHAKAQKLFMVKLKEVCKETGTQVVCTTHSREIFECLPDDARFFVENVGGKTKITAGISPDFAFAKMGSPAGDELEILVEDDVAKSLIQATLSASTRTRVTIKVIGSATAIARQLAAFYVRKDERSVIAIFDGDQRSQESANFGHAKNMAENPGSDFKAWYDAKISYLPGKTWPESWIVQKAMEVGNLAAVVLSVEQESIQGILEYGLQAGKHNEFYEIAQNVGLSKQQCLERLCGIVCVTFLEDMSPIRVKIENSLE